MAKSYRDSAPRVKADSDTIPVPRSHWINADSLTTPRDGSASAQSGEIPTEGLRSVAKWAESFGVTERTVERWIRDFKITHVKVGRGIFVWADDLLPRLPLVTFPPPSTAEADEESEA